MATKKGFFAGMKSAFSGSGNQMRSMGFGIGQGIMRMGSNVHSYYGQPLGRIRHKKKHKSAKRIKIGGRWYKRE